MTMPTSEIENAAEFKADGSDSVAHAPRILRSRIVIFVSVIVSILMAANWFVCATWNHFLGMTAVPAWKFIFPGMTLAFVATTFLGRRYSSFGVRMVYRISAVWLGVLNSCFIAACTSWIVSTTAMLLPFHFEPKTIAESFLARRFWPAFTGW